MTFRRDSFKNAALSADLSKDSYYANRVDLDSLLITPEWRSYYLHVNVGLSNSLFSRVQPTTAEKSVLTDDLNASVEGNELVMRSGYTTIYTIDISPVLAAVPDGHVIEAIPGNNVRYVILLVRNPTFAGPLPRFLGESDLNPGGAPACGESASSSTLSKEETVCARPVGHLGEHQFFSARGHGSHDRGGVSHRYDVPFGIPTSCQWCGLVMVGNGIADKLCFTCSFWKEKLDKPRLDAMVINGQHYLPGKGGFYGRIFHVIRNDGSRWSGELMTQGEIPEYLRSQFPDTACFVEQ